MSSITTLMNEPSSVPKPSFGVGRTTWSQPVFVPRNRSYNTWSRPVRSSENGYVLVPSRACFDRVMCHFRRYERSVGYERSMAMEDGQTLRSTVLLVESCSLGAFQSFARARDSDWDSDWEDLPPTWTPVINHPNVYKAKYDEHTWKLWVYCVCVTVAKGSKDVQGRPAHL